MTIKIDLSRDSLFHPLGLLRLKDSYMLPSETSPQERFAFIAESFQSNPEHGQRIYEYLSKFWLSAASPILSFGKGGLPISCFLPYIPDTRNGLVDTSTECRWLSMAGGGIGLGIGLRSSDKKSTGVMSHLKTYDADTIAYRQGDTRRGSIAAYLDLSHPDILPFLEMRKPTGGDENTKCLNLHHGVNIPDVFMQIIENQVLGVSDFDDWPLIDPHSGKVVQTISARELWIRILTLRAETGEPMILFIDTANRRLKRWLRARGMKVRHSNLCSEITLPADEEHTPVCCLSSLNLETYDDWKNDPLFVSDVLEFLDNVLEYFIHNAPSQYARAIHSARNSRDVGIGVLGWHAFLQKRNVPFESALGLSLCNRIHKQIWDQINDANKRLAKERGEAPYAEGEGVRLSHTTAIAPNATSSIIVGNTSPSVEPFRANAYRQDTLSGSMMNKNKYLEKVLEEIGKNTPEVWSSIIANKGSVQHLDFLTEYQKEVFKTAPEIDQRWIIEYAAARLPYIDQAQSTNIFMRADAHVTFVHQIHYDAWKKGLPTLYYYRTEKIASVDDIGTKSTRIIINTKKAAEQEECLACEG